MKRRFCIGFAVSAIVLLSLKAGFLPVGYCDGPPDELDPKKQLPAQALNVEDLSFFFKQDEDVHLLELKRERDKDLSRPHTLSAESIRDLYNRRVLTLAEVNTQEQRRLQSLEENIELARKAYAESSVEIPLTAWQRQGGAAPKVFSAKIHLLNVGRDAIVDLPLKVVLKARVGTLQKHPALRSVDFETLETTAKWQELQTETRIIPTLGPDIDRLEEIMEFQLLPFLKEHPGQWPIELQLTVTAPIIKKSVIKSLKLSPGHYVPEPGDI